MFRIGLFLATNLAVLLIASITFNLLGLDNYLASQGVGINLPGLLFFCAIFGFGGSFISLLISKWMAKRSTGAKVIEQPANASEKWLVDTVRQLADKSGIKMPEVAIFPAQQSNAFATGWNKNAALVAVSAGLLQRLDQDEVRAVLAHEIGHVANGDMITLSLVQGVLNTFVMFFARIIGTIVDRLVFKNERGHGFGYIMVVIVVQMVLSILASIIVMWFSRWREFRADAAGAELAGRGAMIGALEKLQQETQAQVPNQMPDTLTAFGITEGWKQHISKLFMSHPPLEARIEALRNA